MNPTETILLGLICGVLVVVIALIGGNVAGRIVAQRLGTRWLEAREADFRRAHLDHERERLADRRALAESLLNWGRETTDWDLGIGALEVFERGCVRLGIAVVWDGEGESCRCVPTLESWLVDNPACEE